MEAPSEATQQLLVRLALLSTTASTLMKPTGPTFKDDIKNNLRFFSPIYSIAKVLWLVVIVISLRLPRIMSTKLVIWLTLKLYAHWQVCEANPSQHMKHKPAVHCVRRVSLATITLPIFVAMVVFDDHRWTQFFMAWLVGDAIGTEFLTLFSLPMPRAIYLRQDWPDKVLMGPALGAREISATIDCQALKGAKDETTTPKDNTQTQGEGTDAKEPSSTQAKHNRPERPSAQNLCNKVERLSNSMFGPDIEPNVEREDIKTDICSMLYLFYPFRITWTCGHRLCFVYKACGFLAPLALLAQRLGTAIFVFGLFTIDIKPLLPHLLSIINETLIINIIFFVLFETIFVACGGFFILLIFGVLFKRLPKTQLFFDSVSNSLARRTRLPVLKIKRHITSTFVIAPLQIYFYFINPVPMTKGRLSIFITTLLFACLTIVSWTVSARMLSRASNDKEDAKDTSVGSESMGKGTTFKTKADMTFSLMFVPVTFWFVCSRF